MKTFFKVVLNGLLFIIAGVIVFTTYQFNTYTPHAVTQIANPTDLKYFQESYVDCRRHFIDEADKIKETYKEVQISALKIESLVDPDLTIDYCYIPAQKSFKRLLILTSGVHGIEGYVGSAVQQMFLSEQVKENSLDELGVLIIHAINPYGFKYQRRVTENNVDLNRNSSTDNSLFKSVNKGYNDLNAFLNQKQKVSLTSFGHFFFQITAIQKIIRHSMGTLRQAVLQGQYQYEKGIYFGGKALEPSVKILTPLIQQIAEPYDMVFNIDLHTGYGENGTLHLFPNPIKDEKKKAMIETIFSGNSIDWGDKEDFYTVTGDFSTYLGDIIPEKLFLNMAFEFGTLDTQTTLGAIKALHNVVIENQGVQYGYRSEKDEKEVKSRYLAGYYPSSEAWRSKAVEDARQTLLQAIKKYRETNIRE
ncbi:MAG: DUF2817 domain-containing protein [Proteobacteria bacterium]|nr:DUF2817 domain-containing protein [Pseudomonadota bacterium]MBU1583018.1 DUF2817 domain-containing protein [Pseudomonadota bacterium]MBU2454786.1 DUF2817 domain-containing protein [Pseudomonadota bacterium]MBU2627946.1 DUF2817 domain-containing protein [Pseudomonadota bacterium]